MANPGRTPRSSSHRRTSSTASMTERCIRWVRPQPPNAAWLGQVRPGSPGPVGAPWPGLGGRPDAGRCPGRRFFSPSPDRHPPRPAACPPATLRNTSAVVNSQSPPASADCRPGSSRTLSPVAIGPEPGALPRSQGTAGRVDPTAGRRWSSRRRRRSIPGREGLSAPARSGHQRCIVADRAIRMRSPGPW